VDFTAILEKETTTEELHAAFRKAADGPMKGILKLETEQLVSVDYKGDPHSSTVDAEFTSVMGGNLCKVVTWYDNEWGYSMRTADLTKYLGDRL
jgi:glyceraldehyde 3-phosphate dehydrogenase